MPDLPPPVQVSPLIKFFRYAFLISGIFYGASKLQALKAYEASKADERARKKVEREARLVQEKRMAAERDFQQIVEIFRPPPIPDDVNEPPKLVSEERCESRFDSLYDNDSVGGAECPGLREESSSNIYEKPLDLSGDDFLEENGYIIKEFDGIPVLPPEDRNCRIPPES